MASFIKPSLAIISLTFLLAISETSLAQSSHQDFVDTHNAARAQVGVAPLAWNDTVAAYAQRYANKRAASGCAMEHSMGPYGENLAEGYGELSGEDAVKMWVSERANYDHRSNACVGGECLHYTQVVWRSSIHLGCARVKCSNGWWFVTCNYDPPGNYEGERPY